MLHKADDPRPGQPELRGRCDDESSAQIETLSPERHHPVLDEQIETPSQERLQRARGVYQTYHRWLRLSRLALAAFIFMAAVFLIWAVPWLPGGLDTDDYTPELALTVYLLAGAAITGMLALGLRELARRNREGLMVWATVYDEATGLHNRTYLYDRLSLECERAERRGSVFSVIVLQLRMGSSAPGPPPTLSNASLQRVAELLNRLLRPTDLVGLLSGRELAILAIGMDQEKRQPLMIRLRDAVAEALPQSLDKPAITDVKSGAASYGVDGKDPGALIQAARTAAILTLPNRARAA